MTQLELYYRKVLWTYPPTSRPTARRPLRARADDGLDYFLKDDSQGSPIRAREWVCHQVAQQAGIPVVEHLPILTQSGRVLFGSRAVLNGGVGHSQYQLTAGGLPIAEAVGVLSALYAVDLFVGNADRHPDNLMLEPDPAGALHIRVIDFSEAPALIEPHYRAIIPKPSSHTVQVARTLRGLYGFSLSAACLALDRLDAVAPRRLQRILEEMPPDWLEADMHEDLIAWWSTERAGHIAWIRKGLSDGTLL